MRSSTAIAIHNNKMLFILRDDKPTIDEPNKWGLPGGVVEAGESFDAALKREFNEELGIVPANIRFFGYLEIADRVGALYIVTLSDEEVSRLKLGDESQEFKFFSYDELQTLDLATVIGYYVKLHGHYFKELIANPAVALDPAKFGLKS